jgi:CRISPR-associated endonuclease/helicase Cas3
MTEFWGKAHSVHEIGPGSHPLVAHSLDVAAVAVLLPWRGNIPIDPRMLGFLVSLHDIGKYSRSFQAKASEYWPAESLGPYESGTSGGTPHDEVGWYLLEALQGDLFSEALGWKPSDPNHLWRAVAGHHGRPPQATSHGVPKNVLCDSCRAAAVEFVTAMRALFDPPDWKRPTERELVRLSWRLAGLTTLADWVGSRQAWFPYVPFAAVADPGGYFFGHALPRASAALAAAGLTISAPAPFAGLRALFPDVTQSTPIQCWAETVQLPDGPSLSVIEDLTGSGKTEAALTLAHRLLADGRADGVYLALPTMATANAMFERLADSYRALFAPDTHPSLALAHGHARLDPRFAASIAGDGRETPRVAQPADEPAESHCASWLAEDRRRTLLAQAGVGTLDQALLAVLPVRHATLRLFGIAGKVLIADEVHAFDPYMREELATLLRFHAALGGSAILLSATLPLKLRQKLVDAFRDGLGQKPVAMTGTAYPLATIAGATEILESPCAPREGLPRRVSVTRLTDAAAAADRLVAADAAGAAAVWIRNTVDDAIEAVALLRSRRLSPLLFHARFAMQDRLEIEREVLRVFGRDSRGQMRNRVLVATQVVEQSLDIDFDVMVTDLAPADLLIQRAGRLWRHDRGLPRCVPGPALLVVSPEPIDKPAADWINATLPGTAAVYRDHALLWRSARAVFQRGAIVTPDDMRPIIDEVFCDAAPNAVPPALAPSADDAYARELSHIGIAAQNVLNLRKGYERNAGLWEPDTNTPTRLEDRPHVTLRLALVRGVAIVPYADDPDLRRAWALSEVQVARFRIAECPVPVGLEAEAARAKAGWGRWERDSPMVLLALLTCDGEGYRLDARAESGAVVAAWYDARSGLSWSGD